MKYLCGLRATIAKIRGKQVTRLSIHMSTRPTDIALNYRRKAKSFDSDGTQLAPRSVAKRKFTYKEITLIAGIAVAIVIAVITFWSFEKRAAIFDVFAGSSVSVRNLSIEHIFDPAVSGK